MLRLTRIGVYAILSLHLAVTIFIVFTPPLILLGVFCGWHWVSHPALRNIDLGLVLFIAIEIALAHPCPLTTWENALRRKVNLPLYSTGFFDYWHLYFFKRELSKTAFNSFFILVLGLSLLSYVLS